MSTEMDPGRWGDPAAAAPLPPAVRELVHGVFGEPDGPDGPGGPGTRTTSEVRPLPTPVLDPAHLAALRAIVGDDHVLIDEGLRRRRTRGKSTPDLLRDRAGDVEGAPAAVVRPADHDQVQAVVSYAAEHRIALVPYGGGTAVTGGLEVGAVARGDLLGPLSLDLGRMDRLLDVDPVSGTATLQPGLRGPRAEALLAAHGLTLGHYPQSFEFATVGGFAATRSSGQASAGFGRFDAMVVGLNAATPVGSVELGSAPASAAGPDLRQLLLGSEGALGVITAVTVRVRPVAQVVAQRGWRWASFAEGVTAARTLAQAGLLPTVLRLSDETETAVNLADPGAVGGGEGGAGGCLMLTGFEGTAEAVAAREGVVGAVLADLGGTDLGEEPARAWREGRFHAPYLRDALLDEGVLVETLETATFWSRLEPLHEAVGAALTGALQGALVLCHVSHVYETGASLYFTVAAPGGEDPLGRWSAAKAAASDAIRAAGATITHHHAVGTDHLPWYAEEIGPVGVRALRALKAALDPAGVLNPGVLVP